MLAERLEDQLMLRRHSNRHLDMQLQRRILWRRRDLLSMQLYRIKRKDHSQLCGWEHLERSHVCLQRRILRRRRDVLTLQDVLAVRLEDQTVLRRHSHGHLNMHV